MKASPFAASPWRKMTSPGLKVLVGTSPIWRLMTVSSWYRMTAVGPMVRLFSFLVTLALLLCAPKAHAQISVQEAMLRAKPAVVLVNTEVAAEVTLDCGT